MRFGCFVGLLVFVCGVAHAAPEITRPRVSQSVIEWQAAIAALEQVDGLKATQTKDKTDALGRLNAASGQILPNIAASPIPVLLPLDLAALLREKPNAKDEAQAAKNAGYFAGFNFPRFFHTGPGGYDTVFSIQTADIKDLSDIRLPDPIEIHFSGLAFIYELSDPTADARPVPALDSKYPGIKRIIHEGWLRYSFTRYGVPYILAIDCFDGRPRHVRLLCPQADRIAVHFLSQLQIAGGTPQKAVNAQPPAIERPQTTDQSFSYHPPGKIFPGSGFRGSGGRVDYTVWAPIRFPMAAAPVYANSQVYRDRPRSRSARDAHASTDYAYPWRDNFCERRGFTVGQCPAGIGHQGQDLRPGPCSTTVGMDRCHPAHDLVAVRDGAILRSPKQEALYVVINTPNEHMRFRYLHMDPRKMDEENLLSGRDVREGEVIGQVSNYSQKENGTSYHLHFDLQVPTKYGWVLVNPYMTLVVAYERLLGARGVEILEEPQAGQAVESSGGKTLRSAVPIPPERPQLLRNDDIKKTHKDQAGMNDRGKAPTE